MSEPVLPATTSRWCASGSSSGPGATVSRIWPSTSRVKVSAWMRTASGPSVEVSSEDFAKSQSPVRIATRLS